MARLKARSNCFNFMKYLSMENLTRENYWRQCMRSTLVINRDVDYAYLKLRLYFNCFNTLMQLFGTQKWVYQPSWFVKLTTVEKFESWHFQRHPFFRAKGQRSKGHLSNSVFTWSTDHIIPLDKPTSVFQLSRRRCTKVSLKPEPLYSKFL